MPLGFIPLASFLKDYAKLMPYRGFGPRFMQLLE